MHIGIAGLLALLLGLMLTFGSCSGVDTSSIEDLADSLGIEPAEISLDELGLGATGSEAEADFFDFDDADFETEWGVAQTAQDCADGAGVGTFPDYMDVDTGLGAPETLVYFYREGDAQALVLYEGIFVTVDKGIYEGIDDISEDDRTFDLEWTETIDGLEVQCFGYEEGMVCKALFNDGVYAYSIWSMGPDDDLDRGMTVEQTGGFMGALLQ